MSNEEKKPPEESEQPGSGVPGQEEAEEIIVVEIVEDGGAEDDTDPVTKRLRLLDDLVVHKEYKDGQRSQSSGPFVRYHIMSKSASLPAMTLSLVSPNKEQKTPEPDCQEAGPSSSPAPGRSVSFGSQATGIPRRNQEAGSSSSPAARRSASFGYQATGTGTARRDPEFRVPAPAPAPAPLTPSPFKSRIPKMQQKKTIRQDHRAAGPSSPSTSKFKTPIKQQKGIARDCQGAGPSSSPSTSKFKTPIKQPKTIIPHDTQEAGSSTSRSEISKISPRDLQEAGPSNPSPSKSKRPKEEQQTTPQDRQETGSSTSSKSSPKKKQKTKHLDYQEPGASNPSTTSTGTSTSHSIADSYFQATLDEPVDPTAGLRSLFADIPSANAIPGQSWFEREIAAAFEYTAPDSRDRPLDLSGGRSSTSPRTSAGSSRMPTAENITTAERVRSFFNAPSTSDAYITPPLSYQTTSNPSRKRSRAEATITRETATITTITEDSATITRARATISREITTVTRSSPTNIPSPSSPLPNYPLEVTLRNGQTVFLNTIENIVRTFFNPFYTYPTYEGLAPEEEMDLCTQESMLSSDAHARDHELVIWQIGERIQDFVPELIEQEDSDEEKEKKKRERLYRSHMATLLKIRAGRVRPEDSAAAAAAVIAVTPNAVDRAIAQAGIGSSSKEGSSDVDYNYNPCCRIRLDAPPAAAENYLNNYSIHDVRYETNYILNILYSFRMGYDWEDGHNEMILPEFENIVDNNATMRFIFESYIRQGAHEFTRQLLPLIHVTTLFTDLLDEMLENNYTNWNNAMLIVFICVEMAAQYRLLVKTGRMAYIRFLYFQRCLHDFFHGSFSDWLHQNGGWGTYIRHTVCGFWQNLRHPNPPLSPERDAASSTETESPNDPDDRRENPQSPPRLPSPPMRRPGPRGPPSPTAPAACLIVV